MAVKKRVETSYHLIGNDGFALAEVFYRDGQMFRLDICKQHNWSFEESRMLLDFLNDRVYKQEREMD